MRLEDWKNFPKSLVPPLPRGEGPSGKADLGKFSGDFMKNEPHVVDVLKLNTASSIEKGFVV